jgi:hypothetical protein
LAKGWLGSSIKSFTYHCHDALSYVVTILPLHPTQLLFRGFLS